MLSVSGLAWADPPASLAVEAREQFRLKDQPREATQARARLQVLSDQAQAQHDPLAPWIDYWALNARLSEATQADLDAFYARWPGTYVEDRLRNDWLLELGHRHDWANLRKDYASFVMRDDREVTCYVLLADYLSEPRKASVPAMREAWLAQREGDDGCALMATTLMADKQLKPADAWLRLRLAVEAQKPRAAKQAAELLGKPVEKALAEIEDKAGKYLARKARSATRNQAELTTLALLRVAANDPEQVAELMAKRWEAHLPADLSAWIWVQAGRQASMGLDAETAMADFQHALKLQAKRGVNAPEWSRDALSWMCRAALRARDWPALLQAIDRLPASDAGQPQWQYWRARALLASAPSDASGQAQRDLAHARLDALADAPQSGLDFYGRLAAENQGRQPLMPVAPPPSSALELAQAAATPGLSRALLLFDLDLRSEGLREWNFSLRGVDERGLLAAAQMACDHALWDRCISASERMHGSLDMAQRYPLPYRQALSAQAEAMGIDPAYVYGLIRQESRFYTGSRSAVGAHGLMQLMPPTAKWVAKKLSLPYDPGTLSDTDVNLRLGTGYLKLVLDSFNGSLPLAATAYNAGPTRPRRWRQGEPLEAALWIETIPFHETRDYVKNVLVNTLVYRERLGAAPTTLHALMGPPIGPPIDPPTTPASPASPADNSLLNKDAP